MTKRAQQIVETGVTTLPFEANEAADVQQRTLAINNIEAYEDAIRQYREKIVALVQRGSMSEQTAARLITEAEYTFYQQLVQVSYN